MTTIMTETQRLQVERKRAQAKIQEWQQALHAHCLRLSEAHALADNDPNKAQAMRISLQSCHKARMQKHRWAKTLQHINRRLST